MNLVNLDKSENLKIDFISLSYDKNIKLNFYINKETYNEYENIKLNIINDYYDAYDTKSTKLKNIILDKAIKKGNYYVFEYNVDSTIMYLFGNFKISIEGVKDSINVTSQEYNYKLIDYFKEILYSEDITEKNRNILISLINYGACAQDTWPFYLSETDKTNIISLLKESDRNMTNLTSKAESLLNNDTLKLDTSIPNNYDSYLEDKFYKVGVTGITKFPLGFYFKLGNSNSTVATSQNITLEEFKKYGIIVFEENVFNEVMKTSDDYNNLNYYTKRAVILEASEENYDNLEMGFSYFEYNFDLQNPNKVIYYKLFYKSEDGNLNYSKLYIKSLGRYLKSANNNICKSMLNFIAEVNEI